MQISSILLQLLLIIGGIEQNPGPYPCPKCHNDCTNRQISFQCSNCGNFTHKKCTNISEKDRRRNPNWKCIECSPTTPPPSPPPSPSPSQQSETPTLNLLQFNINGLRNKIDELLHFLDKNKIHVAILQETKLTANSKTPATPGYSIIRQDREKNKGGGLAFLISNKLSIKTINNIKVPHGDTYTEILSIAITCANKDLIIHNVYIPPVSSCSNYTLPIKDILAQSDNTIITGDFNAHHDQWHSKGSEDARGRLIAEAIDSSNFGTLNENSSTRVTPTCQSSPDISLASLDILPYIDWTVTSSLQSDHLPITIKIKADITYSRTKTKDKVFVNFNKADWNGFYNFVEDRFSNINPEENPLKGEKVFREIIKKAANRYIPKGRIPNVIHNIPSEAVNLINERDNLREVDPRNPRIQDLNTDINKKIQEHRKNKWTEQLKKCERGSKNLWKTIKGITQPTKEPENIGIQFQDKLYEKNEKIANMLNRQFTPSTSHKTTKEARITMRKLKAAKSDEVYNITPEQTADAIKQSKSSKALGPDGISPIMLKHIGPKAIEYLTTVFNNTVNKASIPTMWKTGRIVPLLKPGKPPESGKSYRPISLLSPAAKILEKIILPDLNHAIPLKDHQHGFRQTRSTVTALQETVNIINRGFNDVKGPQRTVLVAIDLSKAFDTVSHEQLLKDILNLELCNPLKKFLAAYLRGRQQYTEFRGCRSKSRVVRQGVPQGGILSPVLFNLYLSSIPDPPEGIILLSYADDCQTLAQGRKYDVICQKLNPYLDTLADWFASRKLEISAEKSTCTLFTSWQGDVNKTLPIKIKDKEVPTTKTPKLLGLNLDNKLSFGHHVKLLKEKVINKNNVLKCLAGSSWGKDKEVLIDTYKALGRSTLNYAAPVWTPFLSTTNWDDLEIAQNNALRLATGCVKMTNANHLHQECKVLPVIDHSKLLTRQYLLAMHKPEHPNHHQVHDQRTAKKSIMNFKPDIQPVLNNARSITNVEYKQMNKQIHTNTVQSTIDSYIPNKVLQTSPPEINSEEKILPRRSRTTLAQLRSGYSSYLNTFLHRINRSQTEMCPSCHNAPHTSEHIFQCPAKPCPTNLSITSLWTDPVKAAEFLGLPTEEDFVDDDHG